MIGRLEEWKGQHVFLDAVKQLSLSTLGDNTFLVVGGPVPGKEDYRDRIVTAAEEIGVICLGARQDVPALLRAADISVHCSVEPDPFPGVVVESMLAGAATIAADAGGVPEIVSDDTVGVLVPAGDSAALARELTKLLQAPESPRIRYSMRARERALEATDPRRIDAEMQALYESCIATASQRRPARTPWAKGAQA